MFIVNMMVTMMSAPFALAITVTIHVQRATVLTALAQPVTTPNASVLIAMIHAPVVCVMNVLVQLATMQPKNYFCP